MAGAAVTPDQERSVEYQRPSTTETSVGRASVIAGLALLLMTVLAVFANFVVLDGLVTRGDATGTATAILGAEGTFRLGIAALFAVAVLDLTVAWALYTVFKPVHAGVALLSGWFRAVFAGIFVVAISQLMSVPQLLGATGTGFTTEQQATQALLSIEAFYNIWDGALILVGLHLVLVGYLLYKSAAVQFYTSGYVPKVLGMLLILAGIGYVVDSFGRVLFAGYTFEVAAFTFVGEVLLILWLLIYGRRIRLDEDSVDDEPISVTT
ncbi:hypothetical protein C454_11938 [Haloferax gibbonsii ATCC 33959]|uniref:DUF4386 domain-containing protein n=1 Tax=Haloferax gibbonsii (strain ATCC 33959 / DSM 4427 / JCM 8863 / NBRC 102184 / NCIMB 2188 / Ma 2.38) TaxID=1227459 RepID=M0H5Y2_HALGM|nr:DUF4386 domain-containing protein [Haloferax gibbonsii]ELZ79910.1 hypothetical protein C454_11938 [Haloferax gibbonsii ATCC 33959]